MAISAKRLLHLPVPGRGFIKNFRKQKKMAKLNDYAQIRPNLPKGIPDSPANQSEAEQEKIVLNILKKLLFK